MQYAPVRPRRAQSSSSPSSDPSPSSANSPSDSSSVQTGSVSAPSPSKSVATVSNSTTTNADKATAKNLFKKIARRYMQTHKPPSERELEPLSELRGEFTWSNIISWRDEVGLRRGSMTGR